MSLSLEIYEQEIKKIVNIFSAFNKFPRLSYSRNVYAVQEQNVLAPNLLHASTHFGDATNVSVICAGKSSSLFSPWFSGDASSSNEENNCFNEQYHFIGVVFGFFSPVCTD